MSERCKNEAKRLDFRYRYNPLVSFDTQLNLIQPSSLHDTLPGTVAFVKAHFVGNRTANNSFQLDCLADEIQILLERDTNNLEDIKPIFNKIPSYPTSYGAIALRNTYMQKYIIKPNAYACLSTLFSSTDSPDCLFPDLPLRCTLQNIPVCVVVDGQLLYPHLSIYTLHSSTLLVLVSYKGAL